MGRIAKAGLLFLVLMIATLYNPTVHQFESVEALQLEDEPLCPETLIGALGHPEATWTSLSYINTPEQDRGDLILRFHFDDYAKWEQMDSSVDIKKYVYRAVFYRHVGSNDDAYDIEHNQVYEYEDSTTFANDFPNWHDEVIIPEEKVDIENNDDLRWTAVAECIFENTVYSSYILTTAAPPNMLALGVGFVCLILSIFAIAVAPPVGVASMIAWGGLFASTLSLIVTVLIGGENVGVETVVRKELRMLELIPLRPVELILAIPPDFDAVLSHVQMYDYANEDPLAIPPLIYGAETLKITIDAYVVSRIAFEVTIRSSSAVTTEMFEYDVTGCDWTRSPPPSKYNRVYARDFSSHDKALDAIVLVEDGPGHLCLPGRPHYHMVVIISLNPETEAVNGKISNQVINTKYIFQGAKKDAISRYTWSDLDGTDQAFTVEYISQGQGDSSGVGDIHMGSNSVLYDLLNMDCMIAINVPEGLFTDPRTVSAYERPWPLAGGYNDPDSGPKRYSVDFCIPIAINYDIICIVNQYNIWTSPVADSPPGAWDSTLVAPSKETTAYPIPAPANDFVSVVESDGLQSVSSETQTFAFGVSDLDIKVTFFATADIHTNLIETAIFPSQAEHVLDVYAGNMRFTYDARSTADSDANIVINSADKVEMALVPQFEDVEDGAQVRATNMDNGVILDVPLSDPYTACTISVAPPEKITYMTLTACSAGKTYQIYMLKPAGLPIVPSGQNKMYILLDMDEGLGIMQCQVKFYSTNKNPNLIASGTLKAPAEILNLISNDDDQDDVTVSTDASKPQIEIEKAGTQNLIASADLESNGVDLRYSTTSDPNTLTLHVTNTGFAVDTYDLEVQDVPTGWTVDLEHSSVQVAAGATADIAVTCTDSGSAERMGSYSYCEMARATSPTFGLQDGGMLLAAAAAIKATSQNDGFEHDHLAIPLVNALMGNSLEMWGNLHTNCVDDTTFEDENVILSGDIFISGGATVTFRNCVLYSFGSGDEGVLLQVNDTGRLVLDDTSILSYSPDQSSLSVKGEIELVDTTGFYNLGIELESDLTLESGDECRMMSTDLLFDNGYENEHGLEVEDSATLSLIGSSIGGIGYEYLIHGNGLVRKCDASTIEDDNLFDYSVDLSMDRKYARYQVADTVAYVYVVTNIGTDTDTIDLSTTAPPPGWGAYLDKYEVELDPLEATTVTLTVASPQSGALDATAVVALQTESENDPAKVRDYPSTTTIKANPSGVSLSIDQPDLYYSPEGVVQGEQVSLRGTVHNTGTQQAANVIVKTYYDGTLIDTKTGITIPPHSEFLVTKTTTALGGDRSLEMKVYYGGALRDSATDSVQGIRYPVPEIRSNLDDGMYIDMGETLLLHAYDSECLDGDALLYYWEFSDGVRLEGPACSRSFNVSGAYTADLYVVDTNLLVKSDEVEIYVNHTNLEPLARFRYHYNYTFVNQTFTFNDTSMDIDGTIETIEWEFGDSDESSGQNVSHVYSEAGEYTITLTVTDDDGGTNVSTLDLVISDLPFANITYDPPAPAVGFPVDFFGNGSWDPDGWITNWTWDLTDVVEGLYYYTTNIQYTFMEPGEFWISLIVTDNDGNQMDCDVLVTVTI